MDQSTLKGRTQCCHIKNDREIAYFGFPFETILIYDIEKIKEAGNMFKSYNIYIYLQLLFEISETFTVPHIYFEIISKDSWDRYRNEGISYKNLPISQPGSYLFELHCLRVLPQNLSGNLKRFFIGDYKCYDDITWIARPKDHDV